ncbi:aldo/keto reductase [Acuticoccus sp. MNP-M23]|uniref:aldo/keto reductase n=1 Tax=Acuticoccus sp. MNP-M23 TaxID=3072793 RepID=UPI002815B82D|nr:aldo/keto reductase [Acuticoccus sp. MNP-M23]WMS42014.1 aldo/keto reductase [Acuticoccus sp. MNP-M23]
MKKTRVGKTSVEVTDLAFGTSGLGSMPDTYGYSVDEERAYATVHAIFDGAANVLDTSRNYGAGRSEERVGHVIRERGGIPDGFVISTKIDRDMSDNRLDAARVRKSFEESLKTLGVERIQILHLHDPEYCRSLDEITEKGGALDELFKLKEEGLVDAVGLAMGNLDIMFPMLKSRPFDCLISHNRFTLINRAAQEMFDYAAAEGMTVLNAAPFSGGVLAKGSQDVKKIAYTDVDDEALAPVRKIEAICAEAGVPMGAAALQFSMRDPRVGSTIIGVTKPERVAQTQAWAEQSIPADAWDKLLALPFTVDDPEANRDYKPG